MNIRTRTIIAIVVVLGVSTLALHRFISFQQTASYIEIESQDVTDNLKRIKETFLNDLRKLAINAADWGSWDDTYQFVEDLNREYLNSNLGQQTPIDLDISTIFLLNEAGSLRYGIEVDIKREEEIDFDAAILNAFQPSSPLVIERDVETEVYGLVPIGDKLLMAAIAPIRRSDDSGENRGSFVMGRYLDREKGRS